MALSDVLKVPTFYEGYTASKQRNQASSLAELQQAGGLMGLLSNMQKQQQVEEMRAAMAQNGGDAEKALEIALKTGNIDAAHQLAPLVKLAQERRQREETPRLLADLYQNPPRPSSLADLQQPQELGAGQPVSVAGEAPAPASVTPRPVEGPDQARQARIAQLKAMSLVPQVANSPVVFQRLQAEIDRLTNIKPMVEHSYPIASKSGDPMVQPHISYNEGRDWTPIPGSVPSPKFSKQVASATPGEEIVPPTDDTLAMDAWRYLTDGTMPTNIGRGSQGYSQANKIRNEASRLAKDMGMTPDEIRFAQLNSKTQVQAIGQLARARAQILQFEKTAEYNAELALKASRDVWRTGSPLVNRPLQYIRSEAFGDPNAKVFNAANETFVSEYARVMSGGYGAAQTTEGAQHRAHTLLSTATAPEQYERVVRQLKLEMSNRVKALNTQMDEERQRLRSGVVRQPAGPGGAAPRPDASQVFRYDAAGTLLP